MYKDSLSLFDVVTKEARTTEKQLMNALRALKIHKENGTWGDFIHKVSTQHFRCINEIRSALILLYTLMSSKLEFHIAQWTISGDPNISGCRESKRGSVRNTI